MAFFGLTSLGPQNTFAHSAQNSLNIYVFDDKDFERAWQKVNGGEALHCRTTKIPDMMHALFRGPVPPNDQQFIDTGFQEFIGSESEKTISMTKYMRIMSQLRDDAAKQNEALEGKAKPSCEFSSSLQFKDSLKRHHRMERNIQQKQIAPLTGTQEYGWEPQELVPPKAGREGSEITKFAAELVKNGIYY